MKCILGAVQLHHTLTDFRAWRRLSHCRYHNPDHSLLSPFSLFWQSEHTSYSYTNTTDIPVGVQSRRCCQLCARRKRYIYIYPMGSGSCRGRLGFCSTAKRVTRAAPPPRPSPCPRIPFPYSAFFFAMQQAVAQTMS